MSKMCYVNKEALIEQQKKQLEGKASEINGMFNELIGIYKYAKYRPIKPKKKQK